MKIRAWSGLGAGALGIVLVVGCSSSDNTAAPVAVKDAGVADADNISVVPTDSGASMVDAATGTTESATVTGSISGFTITPTDSFSYFQTHDNATPEQDVFIWITDFTSACTLAQTNATKIGGKGLKIELMPIAAAIPGTYVLAKKSTANGQPYAEISVKQYDATCANVAKADDDAVEAGSGSVTLTSISATAAVGSFSLMVNGSPVNGTFNAPMCANADTSTASATCVH